MVSIERRLWAACKTSQPHLWARWWSTCSTPGTGDVVIQQRFDRHSHFIDGIAAVREYGSGFWGYIDNKGDFVIESRFRKASDFSEGLAAVIIGDKWGYINRSGKVVIYPEFDDVGLSHGGIAPVSGYGYRKYINTDGDFVANQSHIQDFPLIRGLVAVYIGEKLGCVKK